jgi:hypothetical protein
MVIKEEEKMKKLLVMLLAFVALGAKAQTREMYPADRTNRIFLSGLTSGITYSVSYALINSNRMGRKNHLYPILITMGTNIALGALSYTIDNTNAVNKRQNITGWVGGSVVTITLLRIGLN